MAQHSETGRVIALQVKTANARNPFRLSPKAEEPCREWNEWYIFVSLGEVGQRPTFYVVPTNIVAALVYVGHYAWLSGTKKDGSPRKDSKIRVIQQDQIAQYEEAWDLLEDSADSAPVWVPDWVIERGEGDVGWPDGHPGLVISRKKERVDSVQGHSRQGAKCVGSSREG